MMSRTAESERKKEYREDPAAAPNTQVGESRSSLDPRVSDTTRRRERKTATLEGAAVEGNKKRNSGDGCLKV